jgi:hypothetical protein
MDPIEFKRARRTPGLIVRRMMERSGQRRADHVDQHILLRANQGNGDEAACISDELVDRLWMNVRGGSSI